MPPEVGSHDIEEHVVIAAPPEQVWRWTVEDVERERRWRNLDGTGVQTLRRVDEGPLGVGARYHGTVKVGPGPPQSYDNVLTDLEPLRWVAWETVDAEGPLLGRGVYELTPVEEGTRFDVWLDYPPRTFVGRLQRPVVRVVGGRFVRRALQQLRELVEEEATTQAGPGAV